MVVKRFDVRNNFPCRNFSRFKMDFEFKIIEASRVGISRKFEGICLGTSRFDEYWVEGFLFAPR
jgi:hypothetical protein